MEVGCTIVLLWFPPILVSGLLTPLRFRSVVLFTCVFLAIGTFTALNRGGFVVLVTYFAAREGSCSLFYDRVMLSVSWRASFFFYSACLRSVIEL